MRLLSIYLAVLLAAVPAAHADTWSTYVNDQFGLRLSYPSDAFALERSSDAGDGALFKANDTDAKLLIGVLPNVDRHTPLTYQHLIARESYRAFRVDYQKRGKTWLALSGENDTTVFYEKVRFVCGATRITSFAILYPRAEKNRFDAIVERMEDSFQVNATDCDREEQGAALVEPLPLAKSPRDAVPKSTQRFRAKTRARRPYSALANRIARSRGKNVVVVLRRSGPPYDYKIVRGYR
jgi:hypothetical protein